MPDFKKELDKLLSLEPEPLSKTSAEELSASEIRFLTALNKKQTDISMQVEEVYDILDSLDTNDLKEEIKAEKERSSRLLKAIIGICDIVEDFCAFAQKSEDLELIYQAGMMWKNSARIIEGNGIIRIGEVGQPFNPELHTAQGADFSHIPKERIIEILQSGYLCNGNAVRKSAVILSKGTEESEYDK